MPRARVGDPSTHAPDTDPFLEDELRIRVLRDEQINGYAYYLRSRIRLTQALTTLGPAAGAAAVLIQLRDKQAAVIRAPLVAAVVAGYATPFVLSVFGLANRGARVRRPNELATLENYKAYRNEIGYSDETANPKGGEFSLAIRAKALWFAIALSAVTAILSWPQGGIRLAAVPLLGLALTLLCGWSWWRISRTFRELLRSSPRSAVP